MNKALQGPKKLQAKTERHLFHSCQAVLSRKNISLIDRRYRDNMEVIMIKN